MKRKAKHIIDNRGPHSIYSRKIIHRNSFGMKVIRDLYIDENNNEGLYDYLKLKPRAYILPIDNKKNVYLIRQFRHPISIRSIEVVSGGIEDKESYITGAERELKEKLGITAHVFELLIGHSEPAPYIIHSPQRVYVAKNLKFGLPERDREEMNIKTIRMSLTEAINAIENGIIKDTPSQLAISLVYIKGRFRH